MPGGRQRTSESGGDRVFSIGRLAGWGLVALLVFYPFSGWHGFFYFAGAFMAGLLILFLLIPAKRQKKDFV